MAAGLFMAPVKRASCGRIEVRADGQIDNRALKAKLIHRFESRIDWSLLDMAEPSPTADVVGEGKCA